MEQSSFLFAKFDCSVARQNISFLATVHDCETDLFSKKTLRKIKKSQMPHSMQNEGILGEERTRIVKALTVFELCTSPSVKWKKTEWKRNRKKTTIQVWHFMTRLISSNLPDIANIFCTSCCIRSGCMPWPITLFLSAQKFLHPCNNHKSWLYIEAICYTFSADCITTRRKITVGLYYLTVYSFASQQSYGCSFATWT